MVQVDADTESILQYQFATNTVERHGNSYIVTVTGKIDATLPTALGYLGAETAALANAP
jgi:hypothetical protein